MELEEDFNFRDIDIEAEDTPRYNTLKRDVCTRWTSIHTMLVSFIPQVDIVNRWLKYLNRHDLMIDDHEKVFLIHIRDFFEIFKNVITTLEGQKYSTINLCIVILSEIKFNLLENYNQIDNLSILFDHKCILKRLYDTTLEFLNNRFTINDEMLCGSLLDPILQHTKSIGALLLKREVTREEFLLQMFNKYVGEVDQNHSPIKISKNTHLMNLASKHLNSVVCSGISTEIQQFATLSNYDYDVITWWRDIGSIEFINLKKLARIIFQLSATAAEVERLNSTAGRNQTKSRSNITSKRAEKIIMVQYNFETVKDFLKKKK